MRRIVIAAGLAASALVLSACGSERPAPPSSTTPPPAGTGGPCGDGTILQPGTVCP